MVASAGARVVMDASFEADVSTRVVAQTKAARQQRIVELLSRTAIRSQIELAQALADQGIGVTQATLSRDLVQMGAVRMRNEQGVLVYAVPTEGGDSQPRPPDPHARHRLAKVAAEVLVSAEASANLVVLRTPPGAAHYLASAVDHARPQEILGTVAGDDTVIIITRHPGGGTDVAATFLALAERAEAPSTDIAL
ncbi:MAG: arginine repressor [Actinomycetota bacterium]